MAADPLFSRFGRSFPAGAVLFREGEPGAVMYVLRTGRVRIERRFPTGDRTLAVLGPGEFFGEMAILNSRPRTATAIAVEAVETLEIDGRTFEAMVVGNTEIAVRLIRKLSARLDSANSFIETLLERDPRLKVLKGFVRVADEFGVSRPDGVFLPLQPGDLASELGMAVEDVAVVLERLVKLKVLRQASPEGWTFAGTDALHGFVSEVSRRLRAPEEAAPQAAPES